MSVAYKDRTQEELKQELASAQAGYEALKAQELKLNMARGKPGKEQLDMVSDLLTVLNNPDQCMCDGMDVRNYGELSGLPSAKRLFAEILGCKPEECFIGGSASLTLMYDAVSKAVTHGMLHSEKPWCKLDSVNAYSCHDSDTLYGRACIIATLLPSRSVACSRTAAWVWLGGTFPESIDIIAKAHYRALRYGRKINVFNRLAPNEHTIKVGPIIVTTPVRTACDLALNCTPESESLVSEIICMLMQEFHFRSNDCMQIMQETKHIRNAPQARNYILAIDGRSDEYERSA